MKFRIRHISDKGFYGQVKLNMFTSWKTIGKHNSGFGLYHNMHMDYPLKTKCEAITRCLLYKHKHSNDTREISYEDVDL